MSIRIAVVLTSLTMLWSTGCDYTEFKGDAHIEGGAQECEERCADQDLEMAGMVMMGDYTDGCICAVPGKKEQAVEESAAVVGGSVGLAIQQKRRNESAQSATQYHH